MSQTVAGIYTGGDDILSNVEFIVQLQKSKLKYTGTVGETRLLKCPLSASASMKPVMRSTKYSVHDSNKQYDARSG